MDTIQAGCDFEQRTPDDDQEHSWARSDRAFFAAGACHILAYAFVRDRPGWGIIYLRPNYRAGHHVYATDWQGQAFDHNGLTIEADLLHVIETSYGARYPGWDCDALTITSDLATFCRQYQHRPPEGFAHDPWARAEQYIRAALSRGGGPLRERPNAPPCGHGGCTGRKPPHYAEIEAL